MQVSSKSTTGNALVKDVHYVQSPATRSCDKSDSCLNRSHSSGAVDYLKQTSTVPLLIMVAIWNRADHYIFML